MPNNTNSSKGIKPQTNNEKENKTYIQKNNSALEYNDKYNKSETPNYHLILIFAVICIIPFIVRFKLYKTHMEQFNWFDSGIYFIDLFLYYKQWIFIFVAAVMSVIIAFKLYKNRKAIPFSPIFIPLAIYAGLALLSALLSKYSSFSYSGSFEQFESIFALLGYCVTAYYAFLFIRTEKDVNSIMKFMLIAAIIMGVLGLLQYTGHDFFASDAAYKLIVPAKYRNGEGLTFNIGKNQVYFTLYNPNYVGSYVVLFIPILLTIILFKKNIKLIILSIFAVLGLVIGVIGAQSLAGIIGLSVAFICFMIFMWRILLRRLYITIPIILLIIVGFFILNNNSDQYFTKKIIYNIQNSKKTVNLSDMVTNDDCVSLVYKGNKMNIQFIINEDQSTGFNVYDDNNQTIQGAIDPNTGYYNITDERYPGILMGMDPDVYGTFFVQVDYFIYRFTSLTEDGTYYFINKFNKLDKMISAPSAVFTGYETFASNRGYIWSRTIPLLKNYIFLGSGPDTYAMAFPQNDYISMEQSGFGGVILTKPHCLYLQIAVQTGVLSLIAFLTFYLMYFVASFRLYIKGRFNSYYAKFGLAVFISTISYMVTGLVNDSSITTAPIFWTLIGIGIAVNHKAKPLIQEEITNLKAAKVAEDASVK